MRWPLILHRWLGLAAAVFISVAALTGSLLVFDEDFERVTPPGLWRLDSTPPSLREQELLQRVEADSRPAHVDSILFAGEHAPRVFVRSDDVRVYVDPYTGAILRKVSGSTASNRLLATVLQLHVRLMAGPAGEWIVNVATAAILLIVPSGLLLWWRKPRWRMHAGRSLKRTVYDLHNVLGFYAAIFILLLATTGALLGFERPLALMFGIREWRMPDAPHSIARGDATSPIQIGRFIATARNLVPGGTITRLTLPRRRLSAVRIEMRGPGAFAQRTVYLDRYTDAVLRIDDLASTPLWYRLRVVAQALHTGNVYGVAGKAVAFLASATLTLLIVTGTWMWYIRRW